MEAATKPGAVRTDVIRRQGRVRRLAMRHADRGQEIAELAAVLNRGIAPCAMQPGRASLRGRAHPARSGPRR